ncbi:MAG: hypothetical protein IJA76_00985 [Clostridia bacterium]|nr:hypothetical protein [Clostridia bacterium]
MKQPQYAKLLIRDNKCFRIARIHYDSNQVTLQESEKVYNTVSIKNVVFDFSGFTEIEKEEFFRKFG